MSVLLYALPADAQTSCHSDRGGYCVNFKEYASPSFARDAAFQASNESAQAVAVPGLEFLKLNTNSIGDILESLYKFGLGIVGIAALAMFMIAGVQYLIAGDKDPSSAKKRMTNAIWGLCLALASWILLYTINPALVRKLNIVDLKKLEAPLLSEREVSFEIPNSNDNPQGAQEALQRCKSAEGTLQTKFIKEGPLMLTTPHVYCQTSISGSPIKTGGSSVKYNPEDLSKEAPPQLCDPQKNRIYLDQTTGKATCVPK